MVDGFCKSQVADRSTQLDCPAISTVPDGNPVMNKYGISKGRENISQNETETGRFAYVN